MILGTEEKIMENIKINKKDQRFLEKSGPSFLVLIIKKQLDAVDY